MLKILIVLISFTCFLFSSSTDKNNKIKKIEFTKAEQEYLNSKPYLLTQLEKNYHPFLFTDKDKESGYLVDLVNLVSKRIKKEIKFELSSSTKEHINSLKQNNLDFVNHYVFTQQRQKELLFAEKSILDAHIGMVSNKKKPLHFDSLDGKKVGTIKGYHIVKVLKKYYPKIEVVLFDSSVELLENIVLQKIDAGIANYNVLQYISSQNFFDNNLSFEIINNEHFYTKKQYFVFNKNNEILKSILDKALDSISYDELHRLKTKWSLQEKDTNNLFLSFEEINYLKNHEFTICDQYNIFPLTGSNKDSILGIAGDVLTKIDEKIDLKYKVYTPKSYKDLNKQVSTDKCDIVSYILKNQEKSLNIVPTNSYFTDHYITIGNSKSRFLDNYEKSNDLVFYVRFKANKEEVLNEYPNLKIIVEHDTQKIMKKVKDNPNAHFIGLQLPLEQLIQKYGYNKYKTTGILTKIHVNSSFGINKNNKILLDILNKTILSIPKSELSDIANKYRVKEFVVENENFENLKFIFLVVSIITLVIIISLLYIKSRIDMQNKRLEALLELSTEGIFILDLKGKVLKYSIEAQKNLGYTKEEMKYLTIYDWNKHLTQEEFLDFINKIEKENKSTFIRTHTRKNGSEYIAQINAKIIEINGEKLLYSTIKDITEEVNFNKILQKEKEKALIEKEKAMSAYEEARISEEEAISRKNEMLQIQEKLILANEAKSEFLANMSHEIRTPISGIIGITDIMLDEDSTPSQKEYLNLIKRSSISLKNIINDILDFSKIAAGKFEIINRKFNLQELLNDIYALFNPQLSSENISFKVIVDKEVENILVGDNLRLTQVLTNLIGNAVKFTNEGKIELKIEFVQKTQDKIKLKFLVLDTGIGMSSVVQEKMFEAFTQGELSNTKSYQGTGLGLSISKSLVSLMNGNLDFESYEGVGSKFFFTLEFEYLNSNENKIDVKLNNDVYVKKGTKVLVAEDSPINQIVIKKLLSKLGFDITIANDGKEAVDLLQKDEFDIVFMDIQMPNMDGFEATKEIRKFNTSIPIIALSAAVLAQDVKKSMDIGMNAHLKKPIDKYELYSYVKEFLFDKLSNEAPIKSEENQEISQKNDEFENTKNNLIKEYGEDVTNQLLEVFLMQYKDWKEEISKLDEEGLSKYIHKLKGSSANLGFTNIYEICKDIEKKKEFTFDYIIKSIEKELDGVILKL